MVGKEIWGGDGQRRRPPVSEIAPRAIENLSDDDEAPSTSLGIELPEELLSWWEMERWDEIFDERVLWGDLSPEGKRTLRKLLG